MKPKILISAANGVIMKSLISELRKNFYVHNMKKNSLIFDVKNILKNNSFKNIEKLTL